VTIKQAGDNSEKNMRPGSAASKSLPIDRLPGLVNSIQQKNDQPIVQAFGSFKQLLPITTRNFSYPALRGIVDELVVD